MNVPPNTRTHAASAYSQIYVHTYVYTGICTFDTKVLCHLFSWPILLYCDNGLHVLALAVLYTCTTCILHVPTHSLSSNKDGVNHNNDIHVLHPIKIVICPTLTHIHSVSSPFPLSPSLPLSLTWSVVLSDCSCLCLGTQLFPRSSWTSWSINLIL